MLSAIGLAMFVATVLVSLALLLFDLWLYLTDRKTITQWVQERPARGWGLVGLTLQGPIGLLIHFLA